MLTTQCPNCRTAFRITPEQLKVRAGKVRCGHCQGIFNALEHLRDAVPAPQATATAPSERESAPPPSAIPSAVGIPPRMDEPAGGTAETTNRIAPVDLLLEASVEVLPAATRLRLISWAIGVLLALGLLIGQAAIQLRTELVVSQPGLRPLLQQICDLLDCDIPLPRKADLASIEASDLHPDPQEGRLLMLSATLKNRASFVQAYPHLELTLTDVRDQPILRKVVAPADYLPEVANEKAGFAANADLPVSLRLDPGKAAASGYRLYLFYP